MQLRKFLFYIAFTFSVFPAFDARPFFEATSDCHPRIRDAYFSTLLQTEKGWVCDICEIGVGSTGFIRSTSTNTILSGGNPILSVFGAKSVIPFVTPPWDAATFRSSRFYLFPRIQSIKRLPNPLFTALFVPFAKWRERQPKEIDTADDTRREMDLLHQQADYKDAVTGFYYTLYLAPEKAGSYYYRATAKLALGDTELTLGNVEEAQHLYRSAIQDYTHAISRTPQNTNAYVFRSYAKFRLGLLTAAAGGTSAHAQHLYHAAIADCSQAMALYQMEEEVLKAALAVYTELSEVLRNYPGAIRLRERYAFTYHLRGIEKQALGQHAAGSADLQKAKVLQLMPEEGGPLAPTLGRRSGW